MKSLVSTPFTSCLVRERFIRQESGGERFIPCYLVAVETVLNESLRWMVMTENGCMFNSVPAHAICFEECEGKTLPEVCAWDALASSGEIVELRFVKNWLARWKGGEGAYLFSLHFADEDWCKFPDQLKVFHMFRGHDGNFHVKVNNELKWVCDALDQSDDFRPEANITKWSSES